MLAKILKNMNFSHVSSCFNFTQALEKAHRHPPEWVICPYSERALIELTKILKKKSLDNFLITWVVESNHKTFESGFCESFIVRPLEKDAVTKGVEFFLTSIDRGYWETSGNVRELKEEDVREKIKEKNISWLELFLKRKKEVGSISDAFYLRSFAEVCYLQKKYDEALKFAIDAESIETNLYSLNTIVKVYRKKNDLRNTLIYLKKAQNMSPDSVKNLELLYKTYLAIGMDNEAQTVMRKIKKLNT